MDPKRAGQPSRAVLDERRVLALARDGVVTGAAIRAAKLPKKALLRCVTHGSLRRIRRDVYVLVGSSLDGRTALRGATALSPRATICAWSAAHEDGLIRLPPDRVHVLLPGRGHTRNADWLVTHATRRLRDDEIVSRSGIRCTSVPRTLRDMAVHLAMEPWADQQITTMIEAALRSRRTTLEAIDAYMARERSKPLRARMDRLIEAQAGGNRAEVKSVGEDWVRDLVARLSVPTPLFNVWVNGFESDAYFPDRRLNLEFDGFAFHKHRTSHDADRRRDRQLLVAGVNVGRLTDTDFDDLRELEQAVIALLSLRPPEPAPGMRPATVSTDPPRMPFELR